MLDPYKYVAVGRKADFYLSGRTEQLVNDIFWFETKGYTKIWKLLLLIMVLIKIGISKEKIPKTVQIYTNMLRGDDTECSEMISKCSFSRKNPFWRAETPDFRCTTRTSNFGGESQLEWERKHSRNSVFIRGTLMITRLIRITTSKKEVIFSVTIRILFIRTN